jgi:hypothetical protein
VYRGDGVADCVIGNIAVKWLLAVMSALAGVVLYAKWIRPWHLHWGATDEELAATFPGDEFAPAPEVDATHAITIDAAPEEVWPWIVQIGADRAGFYSYSWIENLVGCGLRNAEGIVPEWQDLQVGDSVKLHPRVALRVREIVPNETLSLERDWSFNLRQLDDGRTRLVVRNRGYFENPTLDGDGGSVRFDLGPIGNLLYWRGFFEPGHFIMQQKMMTGIKRRAEQAVRERRRHSKIDQVLPDREFRGEVSVTVRASPETIFRALGEVTAGEMPVARALGELRYLPGRLRGRSPVEASAEESFIDELKRGGTVVLAEEPGREVVFGSAGKYHQVVDQEHVALSNADEFRDFDDPEYEKLVMAVTVSGTNVPGEAVLTLEHRTKPLSEDAKGQFARYWLVIKPVGNFVSKQLLLAVKKRAEKYESAIG